MSVPPVLQSRPAVPRPHIPGRDGGASSPGPQLDGAPWPQAHETFRHLVENSPFGVYVVDADFRLVHVSAGAQKVFSTVRPLLGRDFAEIIHILWLEPFASDVIARFRHTLATGEPYYPPKAVERRRDIGEVEAYDWKLERLIMPDGRHGVVCHFYDLSERQAAEARAAFLSQLSQKLATVKDVEEIIRTAAQEAGGFLGVDRCFFFEVAADAGVLAVQQQDWRRAGASLAGAHTLGSFGRPGWWLKAAARPVGIDNVATHAWTQAFADSYRPRGIQACALAPFVRDGRWVAGVGIAADQPRAWTGAELALLEDIIARVWPVVERARAEAAQRHSEERFRAFVTASSDVVFEMSADWSEMRRLHGRGLLAASTSVGRSWLEHYVHPDDRQRVFNAAQQALHSKAAFELEHRVIRRDGTARWVFSRAIPLLGPHGEIVEWFGTAADVTQRKLAEEALRESEARFRNMADSAPVMIWVTDPDGTCTFLSESWYEFTGQTPETGLGFGWLDATHPDDHQAAKEAFLAANRARHPFRVEYRLRQRDGEYRWAIDAAAPRLGAHGEFLGYIGSVIDITERKQAELQMAGQSDVLEALAKGQPLEEVLLLATLVLEQQMPGAMASVLLADEEGARLLPGAVGSLPDAFNAAIHGLPVGEGIGVCGTAAFRRAPVIVPDVAQDPLCASFRALAAQHGLAACWSHPIISAEGRLLGTLAVYFGSPRHARPGELQHLADSARIVALAIAHKQAEEARRLGAEQLHAATTALDFTLEAAQLGDWDLDLVTGISRRSLRHDRCFGYSEPVPPEQWSPEIFLQHVHPEDRDRVSRDVRMAVAECRSLNLECRVVWPDGTLHWITIRGSIYRMENGRPTRMLGIVADITPRKNAEESVRRDRERFSLVSQCAEVGFWFCDLPFEELLWDARVKEHFWLPPDARVTMEVFYERIHPQDRERTRQAIAASIANKGRYDIEYRTVSPEGRVKWIRAIGQTFYDDIGTPVRFDGVTLDVTQRKRDEDALRHSIEEANRSRKRAEEASRAKDDFLAALSHELRTPLNPVLMLATEMAGDPALPENVREDVRMIQRNIGLEARLIDDLLDLTRISRGKLKITLEPVDTHELLRQAEGIVRSDLAGRSLQFELALEAGEAVVLGDSARLQQVFWNLLKNAVKFTPDGGRITVRTRNPVPGRIQIAIEDTGRGIHPDDLERIFAAFDQGELNGRHAFGGLGLGLSISKALVDLHHGTLCAASPGPGEGATFTVELAASRTP